MGDLDQSSLERLKLLLATRELLGSYTSMSPSDKYHSTRRGLYSRLSLEIDELIIDLGTDYSDWLD